MQFNGRTLGPKSLLVPISAFTRMSLQSHAPSPHFDPSPDWVMRKGSTFIYCVCRFSQPLSSTFLSVASLPI